MEQKAVTCDRQEQPTLICLWLWRFIEQSWQMQACSPETVAQLHTADRISDDWGITNDVHTLCANNGADMGQTTKDFHWLWLLILWSKLSKEETLVAPHSLLC